MSVAAFALHELRTQGRSLRFRVLAAAYLALGAGPAVLIHLRHEAVWFVAGGASSARETLAVLPLLTAVLAALTALDGISREREEGAWTTVTLAGLTNAGYLLRRWLALQALLLPLTALPLLGAWGIAWADTGAPPSPEPFLWPWLLQIVPLAMAASTLALALSTIAGGAINTLLLGALVLGLLPALGNGLLARFHIRLEPPAKALDLRLFQTTLQRIGMSLGDDGAGYVPFPVLDTEAPVDPGVLAEQSLVELASPLALAAASFGLAVLYLRRTRPDVRPWRISPGHPLRTFLVAVSRLRERYTPDPAPPWTDLTALTAGLLVAGAVVALLLARFETYRSQAAERFAAEQEGGPPPTPAGVLPGRWRIEGRIGPGDAVAVTVTAEVRNLGDRPQSHLAFSLDPALRVEDAAARPGRLEISRRWDRLAVELDPPLAPGGRRELRFRLAGRPATVAMPLLQRGTGLPWSFHRAFGDHRSARFSREMSDLSRSYRVPAISRRRVDLRAEALTPVPRYQPWTLGEDLTMPEETLLPPADLELALTTPEDLFLADACGQVARRGRLTSRCRLPVAEAAVLGGHYRTLPESRPTVAVFPAHAAQAEMHLGLLARGGELLEEAWPGLDGVGNGVILEWPEARIHDLRGAFRGWAGFWNGFNERPIQVRGNLLLLREIDLARSRPLPPETLVAEIVAARLAHRRLLAAEDALFFRQLFRTLALQRLGLGPAGGATFGPLRPGESGLVHTTPTAAEPWNLYWDGRFPALVAALEHRAGAEALRGALDDFLAAAGERPGTAAEFLAILKSRSEAPLERMIQDFFVDGAVPEPVLDGVELRREGGGWRVTGELQNRGDGEALCRVVLTTDLAPVETLVSAGTGQSTPFTLTTAHRPQVVTLDPDKECHRLIPSAAPRDRVFFQRGGR